MATALANRVRPSRSWRLRPLPMTALGLAAHLTAVAADGVKLADSESVKAFKDFVQSPPIIKSLRAHHKWGGVGRHVFMEIRSQPGAFYVRTADTQEDLLKERWGKGVEIGGWFVSSYWDIYPDRHGYAFYRFDNLTPDRKLALPSLGRSPVIVDGLCREASFVMNMSLPSDVLGSLKWDGNRTAGTNLFGKRFEAELKVGEDGALVGAEVIFPQGQTSHDPKPLTNLVTYHYDGNLKGWRLPTRIESWRGNTEILAGELGAKAQSRWAFSPAPYLNGSTKLSRVEEYQDARRVRDVGYVDSVHGMAPICGFWVRKAHFRGLFFGFAFALTAGVFAIGVWRVRKTKRNDERKA